MELVPAGFVRLERAEGYDRRRSVGAEGISNGLKERRGRTVAEECTAYRCTKRAMAGHPDTRSSAAV